jgi:L-seryl-tRNA(Ser) seleniumtransferase
MDLGAGKRSKRTDYLDQMFKCLNSAYKPVWVGNCAAAVLLVLNTLKKRELYHSVLLSRGEMVEIGGGFRVPDIMSESGLNIIEVGTTNRTTIKDFERGLKKNQQSIVCRIHPSNFRMEGFTTSVDPRDLIQLSKKHRAPLIYDAGTLTQREITSVKSGFEAVTLSLDKTFGGPQCGLIMATPKLQLEILRNPMYRAMRLDKLSIVALESTLEIYLDKTDRQEIPLQKFFYADLEKTRMRAEKIMSMVSNSILLSFSAVPCVGQMGGGSIASDSFKSWGIEITSKKTSLQKLNHFLQTAKTPMVASVSDGKILINLAAVFDKQDQEITHLLSAMKEHFSQP